MIPLIFLCKSVNSHWGIHVMDIFTSHFIFTMVLELELFKVLLNLFGVMVIAVGNLIRSLVQLPLLSKCHNFYFCPIHRIRWRILKKSKVYLAVTKYNQRLRRIVTARHHCLTLSLWSISWYVKGLVGQCFCIKCVMYHGSSCTINWKTWCLDWPEFVTNTCANCGQIHNRPM